MNDTLRITKLVNEAAMVRDDPQIKVRIPNDAKDFIESEAQWNASSLSSEIVRCIRERMERKGAAGTAIPPRRDHAHLLEGKGNDYEAK